MMEIVAEANFPLEFVAAFGVNLLSLQP